jgi:mono/diheme cytochrome c family protein
MRTRIFKNTGVVLLAGTAALWGFGALADGDAAKGKDIYDGTCVFCHGENGKGEIPGTPNFTKADGVLAQDDATLISHITDGFESPGAAMPMPAKGGNPDLSDDDIENVLAYLHQTFGS